VEVWEKDYHQCNIAAAFNDVANHSTGGEEIKLV
jgi:hypothetical protein